MITPHAVVLALGEDDAGDLPPRSLLPLGGATLLQRLLTVLEDVGTHHPVVLVDGPRVEEAARIVGDRARVIPIPSGHPPTVSPRIDALRHATRQLPEDDVPVLVHDVDRALTPVETVREVLAGLTPDVDAVVPGIAVTDSVKHLEGTAGTGLRNVARDGLVALQSPRLLRRATLRAVLADPVDPAVDHASEAAVEHDDEVLRARARGHAVRVVHGSHGGGAIDDRLSLWRAQIALGLARDTRIG